MKKVLLILSILLLVSGCGHVKLKDADNAIVTFNEGKITSDELYQELKSTYGGEKVMNLIDLYLLTPLYPSDTEERNYIRQTVKSAKSQAEELGASFELFLYYYYGLSDEEAYEDYLSLEYKRNLWINDYAKKQVTDKQIEEYYEGYVYGDIEASHILVTVDSAEDATEEEIKEAENNAKKQAEDIIQKLKDGEDFATVAKEFSKDEATASEGGYLGFVNDGDISDELLEELLTLEDNTYSINPIKTTYGYHIVYRTSQKDKEELTDELKETIRTKIGEETASVSGYEYTALEALREEKGMKFEDTELKNDYETLMERYKSQN